MRTVDQLALELFKNPGYVFSRYSWKAKSIFFAADIDDCLTLEATVMWWEKFICFTGNAEITVQFLSEE